MRRAFLFSLLCGVAVGLPQASAQLVPQDPVDLPGTGDILATALAVPGDGWVDPTSLVVTDEQLASAGASFTIQLLHDGTELLIVDDDNAQCPNAEFSSIQAAVLAASPDAKIRVCPGLYEENVFVTKEGLYLQAPRHQGQSTRCNEGFPADPTEEAIIEGDNPTGAVQLLANNIDFEGFTVQNNQDGPGVYTSALFSGHEVEHNTIQDNVFGLYFNSNGVIESIARHNCFLENTVSGAASSNGVYSDQNLDNARIQDNYFSGHHNAAIVLTHTAGVNDDIEITHNDSVDDSSIALFFTTNVLVNYNKVIRPDGTAIFIGGGVEPAEISFNILEAVVGASDASSNGISLNAFVGPAREILIKSNKIIGFDQNGIRLGDGAEENLVETNRAVYNERDGIRATSGAVGNVIRNNHLRFNTEHDCHDDSAGPHNPPALVANQWINDFGRTENRPGLCKHATVTP